MKGKIIRWEDNRGFGFIKSTEHNKDIYVHISAFQRHRRRPKTGDIIEFDLDISQPKPVAVRANFIGVSHKTVQRSPSLVMTFGTIMLPLSIWLYAEVFNTDLATADPVIPEPTPIKENFFTQKAEEKPISKPPFQCEGKQHCSQMRSCEEAMFYLKYCPNTKMDGDNDGIPCEKQWC